MKHSKPEFCQSLANYQRWIAEQVINLKVPSPSATAVEHSYRLCEHLIKLIQSAGGQLLFDTFMRELLYAPGLGYYSAGASKFGAAGDFVTAPELSPLFAQALANNVAPVLPEFDNTIVELGAGTGQLAVDLYKALLKSNSVATDSEQVAKTDATKYFILEVSADLRERQQQLVATELPEHKSNFTWLEQWPQQPISGVVLANEVFDAMPVALFVREQGVTSELAVSLSELGFGWQTIPARSELRQFTSRLCDGAVLALPDSRYQSERNLLLRDWFQGLTAAFEKALLLSFDYGFGRREYYAPQRSSGTLMCHYRHHAHGNPLLLPGLQDVTAHVDFTHLVEVASEAGWSLGGYTQQSQFLLASGIVETLERALSDGNREALMTMAKLKPLLMPGEMGQLFKVMALNLSHDLQCRGFSLGDESRHL